jgi:hypothetical protein
MMLATNGLYNFSASTPPSASPSISSGSSPPPPPAQSGFHHPSHDFGITGGGGGGVFEGHQSGMGMGVGVGTGVEMGMEMEFGGYGVPVADKEAMLRHFAPAMLQDGQIGVDRDTMMMWSTMPSTLECVSIHLVDLNRF